MKVLVLKFLGKCKYYQSPLIWHAVKNPRILEPFVSPHVANKVNSCHPLHLEKRALDKGGLGDGQGSNQGCWMHLHLLMAIDRSINSHQRHH